MHHQNSIQDELANVEKLNQEAFQTKKWTAAHLRLSEMQVRPFCADDYDQAGFRKRINSLSSSSRCPPIHDLGAARPFRDFVPHRFAN